LVSSWAPTSISPFYNLENNCGLVLEPFDWSLILLSGYYLIFITYLILLVTILQRSDDCRPYLLGRRKRAISGFCVAACAVFGSVPFSERVSYASMLLDFWPTVFVFFSKSVLLCENMWKTSREVVRGGVVGSCHGFVSDRSCPVPTSRGRKKRYCMNQPICVCALAPPPTLASRSIHDGFREFSKTAAISAFQKKITQCFTLNNSCLRGSCLSGRICRSPRRGAPCLLFAAGHAAISGGVCRFYRHFQEQKKGGHTVCVLITIPQYRKCGIM